MRIFVTYYVRCDASVVAARAQAIAVEQSVEMPLDAIDDRSVLDDVVGAVEAIDDLGDSRFAVRIALASATVGDDAGQLLNMLFGNTSLHQDVALHDVDMPEALRRTFGGPRQGVDGLRRRLGAYGRAMTGSALKPQGLPPDRLGLLAERLARGGLDFVKDDHGLADQRYSPFADRLRACAAGVARAARVTGHPTRYVPSLSGNQNDMRGQIRLAREEGLDCAMVAPMVAGFSAVQALAREFPDMAFFAHPSLGGLRVSPELLIGTLFRLIGADALIFPNHGGRFGYSPATCRSLAGRARDTGDGLRAGLPVPAGGMTLARSAEMLDFYGPDTMLLIGGDLLLAGDRMTDQAAAFARAVAEHRYTRG